MKTVDGEEVELGILPISREYRLRLEHRSLSVARHP